VLKVVAKLVLLQEEIFFRSTEVEELPNEILVDLPADPTLELVPLLAVIRASFFLKSPGVYDLLQIFLQHAGSQEIDVLVCRLVSSGAELPCHVARILFELSSTAVGLSREPVPPPPPWSRCGTLVLLPLPPP